MLRPRRATRCRPCPLSTSLRPALLTPSCCVASVPPFALARRCLQLRALSVPDEAAAEDIVTICARCGLRRLPAADQALAVRDHPQLLHTWVKARLRTAPAETADAEMADLPDLNAGTAPLIRARKRGVAPASPPCRSSIAGAGPARSTISYREIATAIDADRHRDVAPGSACGLLAARGRIAEESA